MVLPQLPSRDTVPLNSFLFSGSYNTDGEKHAHYDLSITELLYINIRILVLQSKCKRKFIK
jgi:hypothetical protein